MQELLAEYAAIQREKAEFVKLNQAVLDAVDSYNHVLVDLEGQIKEAARISKEDIEQDGVIVKVARKFKKWYDAKTLQPEDRKALMENDGLIIEVVPKVFELLVRDGKISAKSRADAYREEEGTPAITIKYKPE